MNNCNWHGFNSIKLTWIQTMHSTIHKANVFLYFAPYGTRIQTKTKTTNKKIPISHTIKHSNSETIEQSTITEILLYKVNQIN